MDSERISVLDRKLSKVQTMIDLLMVRMNNTETTTTKTILQVHLYPDM
jgi:hypothetical protein